MREILSLVVGLILIAVIILLLFVTGFGVGLGAGVVLAILITTIILLRYSVTPKHSWLKRGFIFGIIWGLLSILPYLIFIWDTPIIVFYTISLPLGIAMYIVSVLSLEAYLLAIPIGGLIGLLIGVLIENVKIISKLEIV